MKIFGKLFKARPAPPESPDRALLLYESVNEVMHAEKVLRAAGIEGIRVVAPPPRYRRGCDLSLEFPAIDQVTILRVLKDAANEPIECLHISDDEALQPAELCRTRDFGRHVMVRAANMKIVIDKETLEIVNISGGGCSDVPFLAREMVGRHLHAAPSPRDIGYTLCAYTLAIAFEEARRLFP